MEADINTYLSCDNNNNNNNINKLRITQSLTFSDLSSRQRCLQIPRDYVRLNTHTHKKSHTHYFVERCKGAKRNETFRLLLEKRSME